MSKKTSTSKLVIRFYFHEVAFSLPDRRQLKESIARLFKNERKLAKSLNYIFCTDDYLLSINQGFLNHDTYTDIITFELSTDPTVIEGEIYISIDRVKENAKQFDQFLIRELKRVMVHGALHLCGYDDHSKKQKEQMRNLEDKYLNLL